MSCILTAEDFRLLLEVKIYTGDRALPVNTALYVQVESGGFSGNAIMDVDCKALSQFTDELAALYRTLSGTAVLEEPYGFHDYIRFSAQRGGHILVQGRLTRSRPGLPEQELHFASRFDQTCVPPFLSALRGI